MPDFAEFLFTKDYKKIGIHDHQGMFHPGVLHFPQYMCAKVLPSAMKNIITEKIQRFTEKYPDKTKVQELKNMTAFMNSEDHSDKWPALNQYIKTIDQMRGTDFKQDFKELYKIWSQYEV